MDHDVELTHQNITLRPLSEDDASVFLSLVDRESWAGMAAPIPVNEPEMWEHLQGIIRAAGALAFAVEKDGHLVGRTTFYDLVPGLRAEIGNTIYARNVWGSDVNPTAKFLLFEYAFTELQLKRVALRCDSRNERSYKAILRLGAKFEGTLRCFRPAADGTIVDVDYFSVLDHEWPSVREGLVARISS